VGRGQLLLTAIKEQACYEMTHKVSDLEGVFERLKEREVDVLLRTCNVRVFVGQVLSKQYKDKQ
jgi:hypothetical protein